MHSYMSPRRVGKILRWLLPILTLIVVVSRSQAACELNSPKELFSKIEANHPELKLTQSRLHLLDANLKEAAQRPNPQINLTSNHALGKQIDSSETSLNFQYVLELGGKRASRIQLAESERELGEVQVKIESNEILIDVAIKTSRLLQTQKLLGLYQESLVVFKKMRASLRANKSLSPEQRIQEDILDMEVSKHRLRISSIGSEIQNLKRLLKYYSGSDCEIELQSPDFSLPKPSQIKVGPAQIPRYKEAEKKLNIASARSNLEASKAYVDLKIGPSLQIETEREGRTDRYGIALTIDLPILNRNEGARAKAAAQLERESTSQRNLKKENKILIESLTETYQTSFETLSAIPDSDALLEKHHRIENLFLRGLISVPTMLEGHDELLGLIEARDEHFLQAKRTLLQLKQARNELLPTLREWDGK